MKRITLLTALAAALLIAASVRAPAANDTAKGTNSPAAEVNTIGIYDDRFEPRVFHLPIGMSVTWLNYGTHIHTVTSSDMVFDSGELVPGRGFTMTFAQPGTYHYFCRHHPAMTGVIIVGP